MTLSGRPQIFSGRPHFLFLNSNGYFLATAILRSTAWLNRSTARVRMCEICSINSLLSCIHFQQLRGDFRKAFLWNLLFLLDLYSSFCLENFDWSKLCFIKFIKVFERKFLWRFLILHCINFINIFTLHIEIEV